MKTITKILTVSWIVNFVVYVVVAGWLGGNAFNGHAEAGHYYLSYRGHLTEVPQGTFEYSRWHTYVLMAHFAVAFLLGVFVPRRAERLKPAA